MGAYNAIIMGGQASASALDLPDFNPIYPALQTRSAGCFAKKFPYSERS
jgi:hypothetical protein